jgi:hypothetical protein
MADLSYLVEATLKWTGLGGASSGLDAAGKSAEGFQRQIDKIQAGAVQAGRGVVSLAGDVLSFAAKTTGALAIAGTVGAGALARPIIENLSMLESSAISFSAVTAAATQKPFEGYYDALEAYVRNPSEAVKLVSTVAVIELTRKELERVGHEIVRRTLPAGPANLLRVGLDPIAPAVHEAKKLGLAGGGFLRLSLDAQERRPIVPVLVQQLEHLGSELAKTGEIHAARIATGGAARKGHDDFGCHVMTSGPCSDAWWIVIET